MSSNTPLPANPNAEAGLPLRLSRELPAPGAEAATATPPTRLAAPRADAPAATTSLPPDSPQGLPSGTPPAAGLADAAQQILTTQMNQVQAAVSAHGMAPLYFSLAGAALLGSVAWLIRRRRTLAHDDSNTWAVAQTRQASAKMETETLDDILPDIDPAALARAVRVTAISETKSRREATLVDLHQMSQKLHSRVARGDDMAAVLVLQAHLVDFRYTSPWVFLELLERYKTLGHQAEWEIARDAFRDRFGQNAPLWTASDVVSPALCDDTQLCKGLVAHWPSRKTRQWIMRWMLGDPGTRRQANGPPQLPLQVYRDLMWLDTMLDELMAPSVQDNPGEGASASA